MGSVADWLAKYRSTGAYTKSLYFAKQSQPSRN